MLVELSEHYQGRAVRSNLVMVYAASNVARTYPSNITQAALQLVAATIPMSQASWYLAPMPPCLGPTTY